MGKSVKIRAFRVDVGNFANKQSDLYSLINNRLTSSIANDRRLLLNENDPDKEEDLICDYNTSSNTVFGSLFRIRNTENIPEIPDSVFEHNTIHINDLQPLTLNSSVYYKNHYYFLISNNYLLVTLKGPTTIKHFQTYINWLIEAISDKVLYEFTPIVKDIPEIQLEDLKSLKIQDPARKETDEFNLTETKRIGMDYVMSLLKDVVSLDEVKLSEIISAELILKFRKPQSMTKEDYQNYFGAALKPVADLENITFYPKKGKPISGAEMEEIKEVIIETTDTGRISEQELKQEMEKYLLELQNA